MKTLIIPAIALSLSIVTSISWSQETSQMSMYKLSSGDIALIICKPDLYYLQLQTLQELVKLKAFSQITEYEQSIAKLIEEYRTCADEAVQKLLTSFKKFDATLKSPEAKKALRDHYAATKVQFEAGQIDIGISEKQFKEKYKRLEEKRKETWARLEVEML